MIDPVKAVYASQDPFAILQNISRSCIRTVIGSYDVDSVLTTGKNEIQSRVKEMVMNKLEQHDVGLSVVNVTIQDSEPPTAEVMEAFKAVETAKQGKETALNNANKYRNEKLPEATAQTDKILQEAESSKVQRVNEANAEVAKFNAMYEEYSKNPEVTRKRMFYEAMEDVLPGMKVIDRRQTRRWPPPGRNPSLRHGAIPASCCRVSSFPEASASFPAEEPMRSHGGWRFPHSHFPYRRLR